MIRKSIDYQNLHKKIYYSEYEKLDSYVLRKIIENPNGYEAQELSKRVDSMVELELEKLAPKWD